MGVRFVLVLAVVGAALSLACVTDWPTVDDQYVCSTVGRMRNIPEQHALGVDELIRRKKVRPEYVQAIRAREIKLGMTSCELVATWGWPRDRNRSTSRAGTRTQWVYGTYTSSSGPTYVYARNNVVTSWQD